MKQSKVIVPAGLIRNTPDKDSKDGSMLEAINMRHKDGAWRGVGDKQATGKIATLANDFRNICYHPALPADTYVLYRTITHSVYTVKFTESGSETPTLVLTLGMTEVFDRFSYLGNSLLVFTDKKKYILYYDSTGGSYKDLTFLPVPNISVSEIFTETKDITDKVVSYPDPTPDYGLGDYNLTEYVRQLLLGDYYKTKADMQEQNKIEGLVIVRLAYRLFDGTYILHSLPYVYHVGYNALHKPTLSYTASPDPTSDPWSLKWNYYAQMGVLYNFFGTGTFTLPNFDLCGVVESLDIFCSRPISTFNYDLKIDKWTPDGTSYIPAFNSDKIKKITEEQLYKVHSIPISDIIKQVDHFDGVTGKYMYAKAGVVYPDMTKEISSNELLPEDSFSHHSILSHSDYQYNSRLHLANVNIGLSAGYNNMFHSMFVRKYGVHNGYDQGGDILINSDNKTKFLGDYTEVAGLEPSSFKLYQQVWLKSDEGTKIITSEIQKSFVTAFDSANIPTSFAYYSYHNVGVTAWAIVLTPIISYPDYRATKIRYFYTQGASRFWLADYALKAQPNMNIAYYMPDFVSSDGSTGAYYPNIIQLPPDLYHGTAMPSDDVTTDNAVINDTNRMQVSGIFNPFIWPALNSYRFGQQHNELIAVGAAQTAMSTAQYGQFPLYVFGTHGIFTIMHGSGEVLYSNIHQVNNDILTSRDSLKSISGSIVFATAEGIRVISGSQSELISQPVLGSTTNPFILDSNFNHALSALTMPQLLDYLSTADILTYINGCRIMFDEHNDEIIISNSTYDFAYTFNLQTKSWATRTDMFESDMFVDGRYVGVRRTDTGLSLHYLDAETTSSVGGCRYLVLQTRPFKLVSNTFKRIDKLTLRCSFENITDEYSAIQVYGTNDLKTWKLIKYHQLLSSEDVRLTRLVGSYKYFVILFASRRDETLVNQIDVIYEERFSSLLL